MKIQTTEDIMNIINLKKDNIIGTYVPNIFT